MRVLRAVYGARVTYGLVISARSERMRCTLDGCVAKREGCTDMNASSSVELPNSSSLKTANMVSTPAAAS